MIILSSWHDEGNDIYTQDTKKIEIRKKICVDIYSQYHDCMMWTALAVRALTQFD